MATDREPGVPSHGCNRLGSNAHRPRLEGTRGCGVGHTARGDGPTTYLTDTIIHAEHQLGDAAPTRQSRACDEFAILTRRKNGGPRRATGVRAVPRSAAYTT